jgi:hypothetical protein
MGTAVPRSVSASAVPTAKNSVKGPRDQPNLCQERPRIRRNADSTKPRLAVYSPVQFASFHHYEEKSKRVSCQEYGNAPRAVHVQHVQSKSLDSSRSRVVEIESEGPIPTEWEAKQSYGSSSPRPRPPQSSTRSFPPPSTAKSSHVVTIVRKPVGSAPRLPKTTRSASDSIICWQLPQKVRRPVSPPLTPREDEDDDSVPSSPPVALGSPWDAQSPSSSPSPPLRPARVKGPYIRPGRFSRRPQPAPHTESTASSSSTKSTSRPRPRVTFQDEIERSKEIRTDQHSVTTDRGDWFVSFLVYVESIATTENWTSVTDWAWWILRGFLVLYVAASLWSIVAAIKDAVMSACAPVFAFWSFVSWMFGK